MFIMLYMLLQCASYILYCLFTKTNPSNNPAKILMCISCPLCVPLSHVEVHVGQMFQTKVWSVACMETQAVFLTFLLLLIIITFIRVPPASSVTVRKGQAEKKARDGHTQQRGLLRLLAASAIHSWHFKSGNVIVFHVVVWLFYRMLRVLRWNGQKRKRSHTLLHACLERRKVQAGIIM